MSNPDSFRIALPFFRPLAVQKYSFGANKRASCTILDGLRPLITAKRGPSIFYMSGRKNKIADLICYTKGLLCS